VGKPPDALVAQPITPSPVGGVTEELLEEELATLLDDDDLLEELVLDELDELDLLEELLLPGQLP
jgi:hypothetical protein